MKSEDKKFLKQIAWASTIGLEVALSIFIGLGIGYWLDKRFDTTPTLSLVFLVLGVAAGFLNYYRFVVKQQREDEKGPKR